MEEWRSPSLTFSTIPINPDLDIHPTKGYELKQHPTKQTHTTLHIPYGTTICIIASIRLNKLHNIYRTAETNPQFADSLAKRIHQNNTQYHTIKIPRGLMLCKAQNQLDTQALVYGGWSVPDKPYDTFDECFHIDRVIHGSPYNLPLRATTYYSEDTHDTLFFAEHHTNTT